MKGDGACPKAKVQYNTMLNCSWPSAINNHSDCLVSLSLYLNILFTRYYVCLINASFLFYFQVEIHQQHFRTDSGTKYFTKWSDDAEDQMKHLISHSCCCQELHICVKKKCAASVRHTSIQHIPFCICLETVDVYYATEHF